MQNVLLMNNSFNGCTSLRLIEFLCAEVICTGCFQDCSLQFQDALK